MSIFSDDFVFLKYWFDWKLSAEVLRGYVRDNRSTLQIAHRSVSPSEHTCCVWLYVHIVKQHVTVSGGRLAFCDFDTAIAKSIFVCPHDSTHQPRQACESVCVPYLKDMSEFVCVCVRIERVQVDKLQTPTLREWESKRERERERGALSRKGGGEEEVGVEGRGLNLWEDV